VNCAPEDKDGGEVRDVNERLAMSSDVFCTISLAFSSHFPTLRIFSAIDSREESTVSDSDEAEFAEDDIIIGKKCESEPSISNPTALQVFLFVYTDSSCFHRGETAPVKGRSHRVSIVYLCNNTSGREQGG
jgi:hypothetical protein